MPVPSVFERNRTGFRRFPKYGCGERKVGQSRVHSRFHTPETVPTSTDLDILILPLSNPPDSRADSTVAQFHSSIPRGACRSRGPELLSILDRRPTATCHLGSARITAVRDSSAPPDSVASRGRLRRTRSPSAPFHRACALLLASRQIVRALVRFPVAGLFKALGERDRPAPDQPRGFGASVVASSAFAASLTTPCRTSWTSVPYTQCTAITGRPGQNSTSGTCRKTRKLPHDSPLEQPT